jgi:hypothetical protein
LTIVLEGTRLERQYKGYVIEGSAESAGPDDLLFATATVLLEKPDVSVLRVYHFQDLLLVYDNADLAAWFGCGGYFFGGPGDSGTVLQQHHQAA